MAPETLVPEKQINDFVSRLQRAAGTNLESVILYGSAAAGEYHPEYSNVNLLCVLKDTSLAKLLPLAPAVDSWTKQKHPAPLMITREELERSADVFAIEFVDIQRRHRALFGPDPLAALQIPMQLSRWTRLKNVETRLRFFAALQHSVQFRNDLHLLGRIRFLHSFQAEFPPFASLLCGHWNSHLMAAMRAKKTEVGPGSTNLSHRSPGRKEDIVPMSRKEST